MNQSRQPSYPALERMFAEMQRLTTGCQGIDRLLGGGFALHKIGFIYGEAATGKSILAMQCGLEAARRGRRVFYLDSDQAFSANRMEQIVQGSEIARRIVLFRPEDFEEQGRIVEKVENLLTKTPTLLVVDSITGLYRSGVMESQGFFARDRDLNRQVAHLHALVSRYPMWIVLTGQVHASSSGREWLIEPVATRTLGHWSDVILRLARTQKPDVRDCFLEKSNGLEVSESHTLFKITEYGIEDN